MNYLKKLQEQREEKVKAMEVMLDGAKVEERALTDDEITKYDGLEAEIRAIDTTIKAAETDRGAGTFKPKADEKTQEEMEERAFVEYVLDNQVELRAGELQLTQGNNGTIVPTTIANKIIKAVYDMVPFFELADVVHTNGKLSVPVYGETSSAFIDADYVDEGTELTDNIGKFTTIDLTGFVLGALALLSNKLKNNTDIDIVGFVVTQVAEALAVKLEGEFVNGTTNKITGIMSATNVVTTASTSAITYDELVSLKHGIKKRFRDNGVWIMAPSTYTALCKLKDDNGQPYFKETEYKILDKRVIESDSMPAIAAGAKAIFFGDLKGYTIKATKAFEIQILREKFATKNMLGIMAFGEYDAKITDAKRMNILQMKAST